jgi:deoxyribodipyrimidine photo-lyase
MNPDNLRIQNSRIRVLNDKLVRKGEYILYWMQQSQRTEYNHALEYAVELANHFDLPLYVLFVLVADYPEANLRHYTFMLEGLLDVQQSLLRRGIAMSVKIGDRDRILREAEKRAAAVVCDMGYLRHQRLWRKILGQNSGCRVICVESDAVVPVETASPKMEYGAYTLRPKINRLLEAYLREVPETPVKKELSIRKIQGIDPKNPEKVLDAFSAQNIDRSVPSVSRLFPGGTTHAKHRVEEFIKNRAAGYAENSNQPQTDDVSHIGPYLHFGQISPLYLALKMRGEGTLTGEVKQRFLEQIIVRRELSINFVYYNPDYDHFGCLPGWAAQTLTSHHGDKRDYVYTRGQLEAAETHDPYWNASLKEMKHTGYMHNYMRMYWAKKVIEWSKSPEDAFKTLLYLNNKYFLDGRDPNSYAGVAWAFGLHDRPWKERPIFGMVRYMAATGLERKCDIRAYVEKVEAGIPVSD